MYLDMIVEITEKKELGSVMNFDSLQKLLAIYRYQKVGESHIQS